MLDDFLFLLSNVLVHINKDFGNFTYSLWSICYNKDVNLNNKMWSLQKKLDIFCNVLTLIYLMNHTRGILLPSTFGSIVRWRDNAMIMKQWCNNDGVMSRPCDDDGAMVWRSDEMTRWYDSDVAITMTRSCVSDNVIILVHHRTTVLRMRDWKEKCLW